jgi:hypothetical protein
MFQLFFSYILEVTVVDNGRKIVRKTLGKFVCNTVGNIFRNIVGNIIRDIVSNECHTLL